MPKKEYINNWGKWGKEDEKGTLNYLTPELVRKAVGLVKKGKVYSLAVPLDKSGPVHESRNQPVHITATTRHSDAGPEGEAEVAVDTIITETHVMTHIDSLAHCWYGGKLFNGYNALETVDGDGTKKLGIDNVKWLVGRGVLLDIAAYKKVDHLGKTDIITPNDLEGCAKAEGIEIQRGDTILFRTGWLNVFYQDRSLYYSGRPGVDESAASWFAQKEICAVGADNSGVEVRPGKTW